MMFRLVSELGRRLGKPPGFERVVRLLCPPEKVRSLPAQMLALRDEPLFIADLRTPLGWNVTFFGSYEPELRSHFKNFLRSGFVAVDIGANVGWHTLLMAQRVGDGGRVLAFEPNPSVRERLVHHVALNRFRNVEVLPYAVSDAPARVTFNAPPAGDPHCGDGCLAPGAAAGATNCIEVEAVTLDSQVERLGLARVDLIKLDVEGFEWPALRGCERTLARFRPHVVFEYNRDYVARCGGSAAQLAEFFERHRYDLFVATRWGLEGAGATWPDSVNFWAVPRA